ncbi:MAG: peptidoglycan-binding protein, partial [Actinomycetota bacterium]|nr:peptidoglycan-binding protein [Actinomycetota bacterium]
VLTPGAAAAAGGMPVPPARGAAGIDGLSPYIPQTSCDATAKPGAVAFADLVLHTYPGTGSDGIVNTCAAEGAVSEHSEGRAWDWRVSSRDPRDRARAEALLGWLLAADGQGHRAAMARRLGIMYIIFDSRIWGSYYDEQGWRPYTGASPHTDHVHFSFSWAGAWGRTSYWSGRPAADDFGPCPTVPWAPAAPYSGFNPRPCPPPAPIAMGAYPGSYVQVGSVGPDVAAVQRALGIVTDGSYGPQTRAAVIGWQQAHRLEVDGQVGPLTWLSLGGTLPPSAPAVATRASSVARLGPYPGSYVQVGAAGPAVVAVQRALGVPADGVFGPGTRAAVMQFQRGRQMEIDGQVGPLTWSRLGGG